MVTTRQKATVTYKEDSDDDLDVDERSDVDDKPVKKKRRTSAGKEKRQARKSLKNFFQALPLDLVFEVFGYLEPLDLLHLAWTNKTLRSRLMSKASVSVWKTARLRVSPAVPECPPDQSEPQWAHLLYTRNCTICGRKKIQKIDWNLRIRGCETCFKSELVYHKTAFKWYAHVEDLPTVLDVLPYTNVGGWAHGHRSSGRFYYSGAIEKMGATVEDFQTRIDGGAKDAKQDFEAFVEDRKAVVKTIIENAATYQAWEVDLRNQKKQSENALRDARRTAINDRLTALGHDQRDIQCSQWDRIYDSLAEVTDKIWEKRLREKAETVVNAAKAQRLEHDRRIISNGRRRECKLFWDDFVTTLDMRDVPKGFVPTGMDVLELPPIAALLDKPLETQVTKADFEVIQDELPQCVEEWRENKKKELLRTMNDDEADPAILNLATTAFVCTRRNEREVGPIICFDNWMYRHSCFKSYHLTTLFWGDSQHNGWLMDCLEFDEMVSQSIRALVLAAGLDPSTATAKEMDDLDARFFCGSCTDGYARHWRHAARHSHPDSEHQWERLSAVDEVRIKQRELLNVADMTERFKCCDEPRGYLRLYNVTMHSIRRHNRNFDVGNLESVNPSMPPEPLRLSDDFAPLPTVSAPNADPAASNVSVFTEWYGISSPF